MSNDPSIARAVWARYAWLRDYGHLEYVRKAVKCENFFAGVQWEPGDLAALKASRRPALTINKIISTISNVLGAHIYNRTDTAFRPRNEGATSEVADALTKVFMQISDNNQLQWVRSDVFCDGVVTSRGFFDVRMDFSDSLAGEVRVTQLNPKNVLIDADADEYDPDKWKDVMITKWLTIDDIELLYGKDKADMLRNHTNAYFPYASDAMDLMRDRFGSQMSTFYTGSSTEDHVSTIRNVRVIERQHRKLDKTQFFVDIVTGDMRQVPVDWDNARVQAYLADNPNMTTTMKLVQRIRWTVVAGETILHDEWSPYDHFTVVPYFPHFRRGRTVGLVENLIGPQELLNKVSSQELHVVNTTANSGWMVKKGGLVNMSISELEERGATTGLVVEVTDLDALEKIQPNPTPTGLDRITYKAESHIDQISGVSDYMKGFAREDVSAKSVAANQQSGQANLARVMDNMNRTDNILARNILCLIQRFYTQERLIHITTDQFGAQTQQVAVNQQTPEGRIINDLTLGEYGVVVTNQPDRDTFEESQFDQAVRMRTDLGIAIPDKFLIQASRLHNKAQILSELEGGKDSPEAQEQAEMQKRAQMADILKKEGDAKLADARAQREAAESTTGGESDVEIEYAKMQAELELQQRKMEQEFELAKAKLEQDLQLQRAKMEQEMQIKREMAAEELRAKQAEAQAQAKQQAIELKAKERMARAVALHGNPEQSAGDPTKTGVKQ